MRFMNCALSEFKKRCEGKTFVVFGAGQALYFLGKKVLEDTGLSSQVKYIADNNIRATEFDFIDKKCPVVNPKVITYERDAIVLIVNSNYAYDIYKQLEEMSLDDSVEVYNLHFIMAVSCGCKGKSWTDRDSFASIPKVIHTFWFSGEEIPYEYKKCVDTWKDKCPDYQIKMWTAEEYDCLKIPFTKEAYLNRKWAFVADYARIDVLHRYGGIYMDMDVEVIKSFDDLLNLNGFFSFDMFNDIGLEVFGSIEQNPLLESIKEMYESSEFVPDKLIGISQPRFIRDIIRKFGVKLNGDSQTIDNNWFASRNYFNPEDIVIYKRMVMDEDTYTVHKSNTAWQDQDRRKIIKKKNIELYSKLTNK